MRYLVGHRGNGQIELLCEQTDVIEKLSRAEALALRDSIDATLAALDPDTSALAKPTVPTVIEVGSLVDRIARNDRRSPQRIAQRCLEEMIELCLATGLRYGQITSSVADAVHNQCLKSSQYRTVFPSQYEELYDSSAVRKEAADVRLVMLDLLYVCGLNESSVRQQMLDKFAKLKSHSLTDFATDGHTFYLKKPHVSAPATTGK